MSLAKTKRTKGKKDSSRTVRVRNRGLRRVRIADLEDAPWNFRTHPKEQEAALAGAIEELGFYGYPDVYETPEGRLRICDGHLRKNYLIKKHGADTEIEVNVTDFDESEAKKATLTKDPLAAMATANAEALEKLLAEISTDSAAVDAMLRELAEGAGIVPDLEIESQAAEASEELDDTDNPEAEFLAPFPWFGGKSRVARQVWRYFGDVKMFLEPFFGSGACLLNRPLPFEGSETVNDLDGLVANFWRAVQAAPDDVAKWADWPVNENDLHARHIWLVERKDSLQAKLEGDPDYFDAKTAGWWCWGIACWIGGHFCSGNGPWCVEEVDGVRQLVHLGSAGRGVNRQRVHLGDAGREEDKGKAGRGERGLLEWMRALSERLRRVRVCCGDWTRMCGGNSGDALGHFFGTGEPVGIFLDPPYADTAERESCYRVEDMQVVHAVRDWAVAHGDDPRLRICLCGYEGEHAMPANWRCIRWKAQGGMGNLSDKRGRENAYKERLWFSPHVTKNQPSDSQ